MRGFRYRVRHDGRSLVHRERERCEADAPGAVPAPRRRAPGDILLVEQVDRLSRYYGDWEHLKSELTARRVRVVALDLPTSWAMATNSADEFTRRMFEAINGMLLDMLAAVARKDYDDRRRRQAQGQAKAKAEGRYKGRPEDTKRNAGIACMLKAISPGVDTERNGVQSRNHCEDC